MNIQQNADAEQCTLILMKKGSRNAKMRTTVIF